MTKSERRTLIRAVYPRACAGDVPAIVDYNRLVKHARRRGKCLVCGVPIRSSYFEIGRCQMHRQNRVAMRGSLRLTD